VASRSINGRSILCPRECWDWVALDRGCDSQLGALINRYITHGSSEAWSRLLDTLPESCFDGNIGKRPGSALTVVGNGNISTFVLTCGLLKHKTKSAIRVDKLLDSTVVRLPLLVIVHPLDLRLWMANHLTLKLNGRSLNSLCRSEQGGELWLLHGLGHSDSAEGLAFSNIIDSLGSVDTSVTHGALLHSESRTTTGILGHENTLSNLYLISISQPDNGGSRET